MKLKSIDDEVGKALRASQVLTMKGGKDTEQPVLSAHLYTETSSMVGWQSLHGLRKVHEDNDISFMASILSLRFVQIPQNNRSIMAGEILCSR